MVNDFKKNTNKTQLLPSIRIVDQQKKLSYIKTCQGPSTYVFGVTSLDSNPCTTSQVEDLSYILNYQT